VPYLPQVVVLVLDPKPAFSLIIKRESGNENISIISVSSNDCLAVKMESDYLMRYVRKGERLNGHSKHTHLAIHSELVSIILTPHRIAEFNVTSNLHVELLKDFLGGACGTRIYPFKVTSNIVCHTSILFAATVSGQKMISGRGKTVVVNAAR
jgi:hypothetical protein